MSNSFRETSDRIEAIWRPEIERLRIPSLGQPEAELLATLAAVNDAHRVIELGTAIGYSAAYLATGTGPEGQVTAVELSDERAAVARRLWADAGFSPQITLHQGNALELIDTFGTNYDLVFVDLLWEIGAQELGRQLAESVAAALRSGGVLVADNCGQGAPAATGLMAACSSGAFRTSTLFPLGDGLFVAVKG
jgi:predicted O-methyltransferase YrrM